MYNKNNNKTIIIIIIAVVIIIITIIILFCVQCARNGCSYNNADEECVLFFFRSFSARFRAAVRDIGQRSMVVVVVVLDVGIGMIGGKGW